MTTLSGFIFYSYSVVIEAVFKDRSV